MELQDYFVFALPVYVLELIAAIAGTYYLKKTDNVQPATKALVRFLWLTFLVEIIAAYAPVAYFTDYRVFDFVKDTLFVRNNWLYNLYFIVCFSFFPLYFSYYIKNNSWKLLLYFLVAVFGISSVISLLTTDVFFKEDSKFINLVGALLLFLSVVLFYFELLRSNLILNLKRFLPMYISIGVFIFYLCITPLTFFSGYFNSENDTFVNLQVHMILYSNIFMYSCFILGFILCSRKKKSYS